MMLEPIVTPLNALFVPIWIDLNRQKITWEVFE